MTVDTAADRFGDVLGPVRGAGREPAHAPRCHSSSDSAGRTLTDWAYANGADEVPDAFIAGVTTRVLVHLHDADGNHVETGEFGSAAAEVDRMRAYAADFICAMAAEGDTGTVRFETIR